MFSALLEEGHIILSTYTTKVMDIMEGAPARSRLQHVVGNQLGGVYVMSGRVKLIQIVDMMLLFLE